MNGDTGNRRAVVVATICTVYLLLTIFFHHIDKHLTGALFILLTLLIPTTFVAMIVYTIKGLTQLYKNRQRLSFRILLPTIISISTLIYAVFSPWRLDSESLESRVILKACFEGTQNQAYLKLRQDRTFELNWTGAFGFNEWFRGTYTQKADTFYMHYETKMPFRFGDTIINNGENLITINKFRKDSSQYFVPFYLGNCKGLN